MLFFKNRRTLSTEELFPHQFGCTREKKYQKLTLLELPQIVNLCVFVYKMTHLELFFNSKVNVGPHNGIWDIELTSPLLQHKK